MEIIHTRFSPAERVAWERTDKDGTFTRSEHVVESIRIETRMTYKLSASEGHKELVKGITHGIAGSFIGLFSKGHSPTASSLNRSSREAFSKIRDNKADKPAGVHSDIAYFLKGVKAAVPESELTWIDSIGEDE
jgi:hypothetical protein